jgi:signal transduction histidine kinase
MDIVTITLIITTAINILLGVILFFHAKHHSFSQIYSFNVSMIVLWSVGMIFFRFAEADNILFLAKALYVAGSLTASTFLYFSFIFPERTQPLRARWQFLIFVPNFIIIFLTLYTDRVLQSAQVMLSGENTIIFGPLYPLFISYVIVYFSSGFIWLAFKYRRYKTDRIKRLQILYLLGSYFVAANIAFFTNLILPWFGYFGLQWLGQVTTVIMVVFTTIAILKYRLFNVKVIATELFVLTLIALIFARTLAAETPKERVLEILLLLATTLVGVFLIRSVLKEVSQREKIEKLAGDLEKTNKDLENANERLKELDQLKTEFVSLATHQIRGPLTAIRGYASLILEGDFGHVSDSLRDPIEKIMSSSRHLITTVQDFLDISRIEQGKMKYDMAIFDLRQLAHEVADELKPNIEKAGLTLAFKADKDADYSVKGDASKIRQVVQNLIDNAQKYSKNGTVHVSLTKSSDHKKVIISVKDNGIGIAAETIPKLFEKFTRAKDANKTNVIGTGLGLYVAREMIKAHNGRIWVESEGEGKGATFSFELDAAK